MTDVSTEAKQEKKFDAEAFAMNVARALESGGKALAAYLKPRELGRNDSQFAEEITEVAKTLGQVADMIGDRVETDNEFASAVAIFERQGLADRLMSCRARYAQILERRGDTAGALEQLKLAVAVARPNFAPPAATSREQTGTA